MTDPQPPRGRFILPRNLLATLKKLQERAPRPSLSGDERDSFVIELALLGTEAQKIPGNSRATQEYIDLRKGYNSLAESYQEDLSQIGAPDYLY